MLRCYLFEFILKISSRRPFSLPRCTLFILYFFLHRRIDGKNFQMLEFSIILCDVCKRYMQIQSSLKTHIVIADKRVLSDKGKITNSNITLSISFNQRKRKERGTKKKQHFGENANKRNKKK